MVFIRQEVITPILEKLHQQNLSESLLHNFFAVGEKGNAWIEDEEDSYDMSTAISKDFAAKVKTLIEKEFSKTMFYDTTKKTMISTEMHTGLPVEKYLPARDKLSQIFYKMLDQEKLKDKYIIDATITAVDVQHITAGKALGTKKFFHSLANTISSLMNLLPLETAKQIWEQEKNYKDKVRNLLLSLWETLKFLKINQLFQ